MTGTRALPRAKVVLHGRSGARVRTVLRLARWHATLSGGRLVHPVLVALDRLLPDGPLPALSAELAPGVTLPLEPAGAVARGAVLAAGYEHREIEVLAHAVRPGGVFVDVGANIGWFSLAVAAHRADCRVWAVEAVPATAEVLRGNVSRSGLSTVEVLAHAAGRAHGTVRLAVPADSAYAGGAADGEAVTVPCRPLDEVWAAAGRPRVDAMKVDVEGAELDVLAGAEQVLRRDHPVLLLEANTGQAAAAQAELLAGFGYRRITEPGLLSYNALFSVRD